MSALLLSASSAGQAPPLRNGVTLGGEVRLGDDSLPDSLYVELYDPHSNIVVARSMLLSGRFDFPPLTPGVYVVRIARAPGEQPIFEETQQIEDSGSRLVLKLPPTVQENPPSGTISVRELERPIPEQALRAADDAQRFSQSGDTRKAIVKLEDAVRIAPAYRDAHVNLGVEYARAGRIEDAIAQFHKGLEIGPPAAIIYTDLALAYSAIGQFREAEAAASKALALDASSPQAKNLLEYAKAR
jgi:tetratricopeptide (TPR) repeat protein